MAAAVQDLFYNRLISDYLDTGCYLERGWLEELLYARLQQPDVRFVLLTGQPGAGKSSFAAGLARKNTHWLRYFIRRDQYSPIGGTGARSFLLQIGFQFAALYPQVFQRQLLEVHIRQRVGRVSTSGRVVGAKVEQLIASPFFRAVIDISQQVQENQGDVTGLQVEKWVSDPRLLLVEDLAYLALLDPASMLLETQPGIQLMIVVDALDELRFRPESTGLLDWLATCPDLPPNCRFVLTSRDDPDLLARLRSRGNELVELEIAAEDQQVQQDAAAYVRYLTNPVAVRTMLGTPQAVDEFTQQAVTKAEGNLGYLNAFRRAIEHAVNSEDQALLGRLLNLSTLPSGLSALYTYLLNLVHQSVESMSVEVEDVRTGERHYLRAWPAIYQKILAVLAIAYEPLSAGQIARLAGISASRVDILESLSTLAQLLEGESTFRCFHSSLADFLTNPTTADGPSAAIFAVDAPAWHARIARAIISAYRDDWSACDTYGLQYLLQHLLAAKLELEDWGQLLDTILTEPFIRARGERFGWHLPLIQDLASLRDVAPLQVVRTGLKIVTGKHRNSLANQEVLRLLLATYASLSSEMKMAVRPKASTHHRLVYDLLDALQKPSEDALAAIVPYLDPEQVSDVRIKGIVVLAVAETRAPQARATLEEVLLHPERFVQKDRDRAHLRWCAADGLLALNDSACVQDLQVAFWKPEARAWEQHVILYVLGRMRADLPLPALRRMIDAGLSNPQPFLPRVVDAIELLAPITGTEREAWVNHFQNELLSGLGLFDRFQRRPWRHPLLIKRVIVALGRIGTAEVVVPLQSYLASVEAMQMPEAKKENLLKAGKRALAQLSQRHKVVELVSS